MNKHFLLTTVKSAIVVSTSINIKQNLPFSVRQNRKWESHDEESHDEETRHFIKIILSIYDKFSVQSIGVLNEQHFQKDVVCSTLVYSTNLTRTANEWFVSRLK